MAAEPQTVKAPEHEVAALDRAPGVEPSPPELGRWIGQRVMGAAGGDPPDLPRILASADTATRVRLIGDLQRRHGNAHVQRLLAARSPAPVPAARGSGVPGVLKASMLGRVEGLASINRQRVLPMSSSIVAEIVGLVGQYARQGDDAYRRGATDRPSAYVDTFIQACLIKAYDRGVVVTDYSNLWDDILENASSEQAAELRRQLSSVSSEYASYQPTVDPDAASFWKDVGDPVFFRAFQLMSFGIVDKELFEEGDRAAKSGDYTGFAGMIGLRAGRAVLDVFTLGAGSAYLEGCWRYAEENPEASWDEGAYAGMVSAWDAVVPTQEFFTMYNAARGLPNEPGGIPPDKWQAMEAFFAGALKVIGLVASAKGARAKAKKMGTKSPTADDLHGQATKSAKADVKGGPKEGATVALAPIDVRLAVNRVREIAAEGGWKKALERTRQGPVADKQLAAMEQARVRLQEDLGGVRTGRSGAASDMDVTVRTYAEAQAWMQAAAQKLFEVDLSKLPPDQRGAMIRRVHEALDVNLATDAGRVTFFESPTLSSRAATRVEAVGMRAAELFRIRILKGLAGENPEAARQLEVAAREAGVDPARIKPIRRVPEHKMTPDQVARIEGLRRQADWYAKKGQLSEAEARRLVELQTELLAYDPETYFYGGAVKGEVGMRTPGAAIIAPPKGGLSANQGLGNIRNNHLNAMNLLTEGLPRETGGGISREVMYSHAGGEPSFAKYVWRVLRTADQMGEQVDAGLLEQSKRLYKGKKAQIDKELPGAFAKRRFAEDCLKELERVESAITERAKAPETYARMQQALLALAGARADELDDLFGPMEAEVLDAAGPAPVGSRPQERLSMPGRDFERAEGARTGGIVADDRTRSYEADVLPEIYLRQRDRLKLQILSRIREEGQRTLDVNREGSITPATAWWDCLLNADADDYFDPIARIMITPKESAVDREGAIVEIDNFLSVEPAFPGFVSLYRTGLADYIAGRRGSLAGAGRR